MDLALEQLLKQQAADQVLAYIQSGMIVGLGHGSTATLAGRVLAGELALGELNRKADPCSGVIEAEARCLGIPARDAERTSCDRPDLRRRRRAGTRAEPDQGRQRSGHTVAPFRTEQCNLILDCSFGLLDNPERLGARVDGRTGIVAQRLFLGLATDVIVAGASGTWHLKHET